MVIKGHIYRGRKPVHWSPSSRTALAEAELVYPEGHKSRSIYVSMPVSKVVDSADAELAAALEGAAFAVWTTTPWTIPANLAVAVNDRLQYSVVQVCPPTSRRTVLQRVHLLLCGWSVQSRVGLRAAGRGGSAPESHLPSVAARQIGCCLSACDQPRCGAPRRLCCGANPRVCTWMSGPAHPYHSTHASSECMTAC